MENSLKEVRDGTRNSACTFHKINFFISEAEKDCIKINNKQIEIWS